MLADDLRTTCLFDGLSDAQREELAAAGEAVAFAHGDIMWREGEPADYFWVLLDGRVETFRHVGREELTVGVMERAGVWAGGFRAWDDAARYFTSGRGVQNGRMFRVLSPTLAALVRSWFPFGMHVIQGIFGTVRGIEARTRERESLIALGTLSAGLAHEINNPAAAATRGVAALREAAAQMRTALVGLAERELTAEQFRALERLREPVVAANPVRDPLVVADHEETLGAWFDSHDVADGWLLASPLATAGADTQWCDRVSETVGARALAPAFSWIAGTITAETLLSELEEATGRISDLVAAVKSYSQMDRSSTQVVDLTEGIDSTLVMLAHKLRYGVEVVRAYAPELPHVEAHGAELNQVWTNVIDNAIDAMDGKGTLTIATRADGDSVVVEIADTGSGLSPDVQARAFDPFFTTKDVGKGTGLGLDIARRIVVERHGGEIKLASGSTGAIVTVRLLRRLPAAGS
jgi:signal transduction histidine kinase